MSGDRCLARLEELTLDNEVLKKENQSLKKVLVDLKNENKEHRDKIDKFKAAINRWSQSKEDMEV